MRGSVADFDAPSFKSKLMLKFPQASDVTLTVTAGSVNVKAELVMRSESDAKAVQSTIRATSVAQLSAELGVAIQAKSDPTVSTELVTVSDGEDALGMGTAGGGTDVGVLVGGIAGGIFGGALLALGLARLWKWYRRLQQRKKAVGAKKEEALERALSWISKQPKVPEGSRRNDVIINPTPEAAAALRKAAAGEIKGEGAAAFAAAAAAAEAAGGAAGLTTPHGGDKRTMSTGSRAASLVPSLKLSSAGGASNRSSLSSGSSRSSNFRVWKPWAKYGVGGTSGKRSVRFGASRKEHSPPPTMSDLRRHAGSPSLAQLRKQASQAEGSSRRIEKAAAKLDHELASFNRSRQLEAEIEEYNHHWLGVGKGRRSRGASPVRGGRGGEGGGGGGRARIAATDRQRRDSPSPQRHAARSARERGGGSFGHSRCHPAPSSADASEDAYTLSSSRDGSPRHGHRRAAHGRNAHSSRERTSSPPPRICASGYGRNGRGCASAPVRRPPREYASDTYRREDRVQDGPSPALRERAGRVSGRMGASGRQTLCTTAAGGGQSAPHTRPSHGPGGVTSAAELKRRGGVSSGGTPMRGGFGGGGAGRGREAVQLGEAREALDAAEQTIARLRGLPSYSSMPPGAQTFSVLSPPNATGGVATAVGRTGNGPVALSQVPPELLSGSAQGASGAELDAAAPTSPAEKVLRFKAAAAAAEAQRMRFELDKYRAEEEVSHARNTLALAAAVHPWSEIGPTESDAVASAAAAAAAAERAGLAVAAARAEQAEASRVNPLSPYMARARAELAAGRTSPSWVQAQPAWLTPRARPWLSPQQQRPPPTSLEAAPPPAAAAAPSPQHQIQLPPPAPIHIHTHISGSSSHQQPPQDAPVAALETPPRAPRPTATPAQPEPSQPKPLQLEPLQPEPLQPEPQPLPPRQPTPPRPPRPPRPPLPANPPQTPPQRAFPSPTQPSPAPTGPPASTPQQDREAPASPSKPSASKYLKGTRIPPFKGKCDQRSATMPAEAAPAATKCSAAKYRPGALPAFRGVRAANKSKDRRACTLKPEK